MSDSPTTSSFVIEATAKSLQQDVIERSQSVPVVIDFWAEWCGPCRMLGPVLEKLASEYNGKFLLAKVNVDTESELAAQFGVRSIPAVFAVRGGKAVDGFVGVQPESAIRAWIDRLLPTPAETLAAEAALLVPKQALYINELKHIE
jgi:putative thioredoxin